jgi:hypothetical protein
MKTLRSSRIVPGNFIFAVNNGESAEIPLRLSCRVLRWVEADVLEKLAVTSSAPQVETARTTVHTAA